MEKKQLRPQARTRGRGGAEQNKRQNKLTVAPGGRQGDGPLKAPRPVSVTVLSESHRTMLERSGITSEVIAARSIT